MVGCTGTDPALWTKTRPSSTIEVACTRPVAGEFSTTPAGSGVTADVTASTGEAFSLSAAAVSAHSEVDFDRWHVDVWWSGQAYRLWVEGLSSTLGLGTYDFGVPNQPPGDIFNYTDPCWGVLSGVSGVFTITAWEKTEPVVPESARVLADAQFEFEFEQPDVLQLEMVGAFVDVPIGIYTAE
jgi:hypothetical protein